MNETNKIASTHLGKKSLGSEKYDASLLVAIPRIENRKQYDIQNDSLPFFGYDVWHAYEFSVLNENNLHHITLGRKHGNDCNVAEVIGMQIGDVLVDRICISIKGKYGTCVGTLNTIYISEC